MEKLKSLYIDRPTGSSAIKSDDFLVSIGAKRSNSVYHIAQVRSVPRMNGRMTRYYVKVFDSDLITALKRTTQQQIIPVHWYKR